MRRLLTIWREISVIGIRRGDLVLEVGSGQRPHFRSDVLCDMFLDDNTERAGGSTLLKDRPMICGNAEQLPFRDGAFDFLIASHLLEHLVQPERFLEEAMRVSRRGFIVTPSELAEKIMGGWAFHLWLVSISKDGSLKLVQKQRANEADIPSTLHQLWLTDARFRRFYQSRLDVFETRFKWQDRFSYCVIRKEEAVPSWLVKAHAITDAHAETNDRKSGMKPSMTSVFSVWVRRVLSLLIRRAHGSGQEVNLARLIVCPVCRGDLQSAPESKLICASCGRTYPIRSDGIPVLLAEAAI